MSQSPLETFVGAITLSELSARSGKSVAQIIGWASGAKAPVAATPKRAPKAKAGSVNTRTPDGRAAYDEGVLAAVVGAGGPVGATLLRKQVGGTGLQMRTALNRLIEAGKVSYEGKARATKYQAR